MRVFFLAVSVCMPVIVLSGCQTTDKKEMEVTVRSPQQAGPDDSLAAAVASLTSANGSPSAPQTAIPEATQVAAIPSIVPQLEGEPVTTTTVASPAQAAPDVAVAQAMQAQAAAALVTPAAMTDPNLIPSVANGILPPMPAPERQIVTISGPQAAPAPMQQSSMAAAMIVETPPAPKPTITYAGKTKPGRF